MDFTCPDADAHGLQRKRCRPDNAHHRRIGGAGMPIGYKFRLGRLDCKVGEGYGMLADGSALAGSMARTIDLVRQMTESVGIPLLRQCGWRA